MTRSRTVGLDTKTIFIYISAQFVRRQFNIWPTQVSHTQCCITSMIDPGNDCATCQTVRASNSQSMINLLNFERIRPLPATYSLGNGNVASTQKYSRITEALTTTSLVEYNIVGCANLRVFRPRFARTTTLAHGARTPPYPLMHNILLSMFKVIQNINEKSTWKLVKFYTFWKKNRLNTIILAKLRPFEKKSKFSFSK